MSISAWNEGESATIILDIGPKQSQELLSSIDIVLDKAGLKPADLDYSVLTKGPGTFTGLRLAFAALKAIQLANNVPVYGVSTLEAYAYPYMNFDAQVVSTIDAKKDQFFAAIYYNGKEILKPQDTLIDVVLENIDSSKNIICTGPDAESFKNQLLERNSALKIISITNQPVTSLTLFQLAEKMIEEKKEPLKDFEGPEYLRKSEAELALEKK